MDKINEFEDRQIYEARILLKNAIIHYSLNLILGLAIFSGIDEFSEAEEDS